MAGGTSEGTADMPGDWAGRSSVAGMTVAAEAEREAASELAGTRGGVREAGGGGPGYWTVTLASSSDP